MNKKEMTEIFSIMLLAWPGAEMFQGGIQKLAPTIQLWTNCLADVDKWTAQKAVMLLCDECKYPPTIAEFRKKVDSVNGQIQTLISEATTRIRSAEFVYGSIDAYYEKLPEGNFDKAVIAALGGPQKLVINNGGEMSIWNWDGFCDMYKRMLRMKSDDVPQRASLGEGERSGNQHEKKKHSKGCFQED